MSRSHEAVVADQYRPQAAAYVTSAVHAAGDDLDQLSAWAAASPGGRAIDLGCGGGHVSYRLAPHMQSVLAYDLTQAMLDSVAAEATARGLSNIAVKQGAAEHLPFADASFDAVASRFSAHHWRDLDAGLREARRVLAPGGRALFIDTVSPGQPLMDTALQALELLRDPSHGRDYGAAEWHAALTKAGFAVHRTTSRRLRLDFAAWTRRMATPAAHVAAILSLQAGLSGPARLQFAVEPDGSFTIDTLTIETLTIETRAIEAGAIEAGAIEAGAIEAT